MQFRVGINLGDVIPDGERIYGDGVNIAARLERLAEAGGICISGTVYDQVATKLALRYEFLGERRVKNITNPVRVYRVHTESGPPGRRLRHRNRLGAEPWSRVAFALVGLLILGGGVVSWQVFLYPSLPMAVAPAQNTSALVLPNRPSIAVLPFVNMSGEPGQEYFSDGMTEDLITDLARLAGLFVIARNSVFTYKGKAVKPDQVGQELKVQYILEGSVRKANNRVRITAQLIDAATGYHLWAERYDRDLQDIFAVQDEIAWRITRALAVRLTREEKEQMEQKCTTNVEAWEYFMRGAELYRQYTKEANAQARELFEKAISLDPQFARAYANLAGTHRADWTYEWSPDLPASQQRALELAQKSVDLDPSLPYGHQQLAYLYVYKREHDRAIAEAQEAVRLGGSSYADGYAVLAQTLIYGGQPDQAIELMERAISLDPKPAYYRYHIGQAYYVMGQYEKYNNGQYEKALGYYRRAEEYLNEAKAMSPKHRPSRGHLVAVYIESGQGEKARAEWDSFPAMDRLIDLEKRRQLAPYRDEALTQRFVAALRRVGLEGKTQ
jgi:adenylate cyclase